MPRRLNDLATKRNPARTATRRREVPLGEAAARVFTRWQTSGTHTEQTLARMSETIRRFTFRLDAEGYTTLASVTPAAARAFVDAATRAGQPPELATRHARRTALRTFYRTLRELGLHEGDPTLDLVLPPRGLLVARPLTDDEVTLGRTSAQIGLGARRPMRAVVWALAEATAVSSEITAVRIADLDDPADPATVRLPGTRRHDARTAELTDWGRRVVAARVRSLRTADADPSTLLAYGGAAPPGAAKAQASVCNALRDILNVAGLGREPDIRPTSVRHWAGRRGYDAGQPIHAVARALGHRSLDAAAEDIALTWRETAA
jgi:site-specific recombinase XerD